MFFPLPGSSNAIPPVIHTFQDGTPPLPPSPPHIPAPPTENYHPHEEVINVSFAPDAYAPHASAEQKLPSITPKLVAKIIKREFVEFEELIPAPVISRHDNSTRISMGSEGDVEVSTKKKLSPVTTFQAWMRAWNRFMQTALYHNTHNYLDLLAYQYRITEYASKYKIMFVLEFDISFRKTLANNQGMSFADTDEELRSTHLDGNHLPTCYSCFSTGHTKEQCPRSKSIVNNYQTPFQRGKFQHASYSPYPRQGHKALPLAQHQQQLPQRGQQPFLASGSAQQSPQYKFNSNNYYKPAACMQFNKVSGCPRGTNCNFQHICESCAESHPKFACKQQ